MTRSISAARPLLAMTLLFTAAALAADPPATKTEGDGPKGFAAAYEAAFNKHDAAAVGKLWAENGIHIDRETGVRTEGRAAIQKDLEDVFKAVPEVRIAIEPGTLRMIQPTVAQTDGTATTASPDDEPVVVAFTAVLVKNGDQWLLDNVEEMPMPQPEGSRDALKALDFLVGEWSDEGDEGKTTSSFHWAAEGTFLVRSFKTHLSDEIQSEGTQVIGWDPRSKEIRSWTFNSDGSFGDATWSRNGNDWLIKSSQTLADGGAASGTYVVTAVDANTMTVKLIGHEVNGEPIPAVEPVTVVRATKEVAADAASKEPARSTPAAAPKGGDK
jgi:uncharacterized protein (TIGR02246 family)